ncbi:MAG: O-antigen/teichoic acid export membrane protein, partial [Limisphaerales bacterium]
MGKVYKQGAWNTVLLFLGIGIGFINEFILLRNVLESDEVGLLKILMQIAPIVVQLSSIGGVSILIRYFPKFKNRDSSHGGILFGVISLAHLGFLFVGSLMFFFRNEIETSFGAKAPLFAEYYYLLFPISLFLLNFFIIEAYSRANYRTVVPIFLNEVLLRLLVSISVLFYAFDLISLHNFFIAFTIANCMMPILLAGWLYYKGDLHFKYVKTFFDKALFSQILKFGFYTMLSGFGARLYLNIDSIMIGKIIGLSALAVYALGMYLSAMIIAPGRAIMRVAQPLVAEFINDNKIEEMDSLYKKVSINNLIACGGLYLLVQAGLPAVMTFIQDQKLYAGTILVFNILGLSRVYIMAAGINGAIIVNSIYYRFILYSNIVTVFIAIGFNMLLI